MVEKPAELGCIMATYFEAVADFMTCTAISFNFRYFCYNFVIHLWVIGHFLVSDD